jgi:hypothetical protein
MCSSSRSAGGEGGADVQWPGVVVTGIVLLTGDEVEQRGWMAEGMFACERHEASGGASFVELGAQVIVVWPG